MEIFEFVDQQAPLPPTIDAFVEAHADDLQRNGSVVASWRYCDANKLGPFFRLTCRGAEGRQSSVYVPRESVEQVRAELARIQAPRRQNRRLVKARGQLRAAAA